MLDTERLSDEVVRACAALCTALMNTKKQTDMSWAYECVRMVSQSNLVSGCFSSVYGC